MASLQAEVAVDVRCELGEGPAWDSRTGELIWVDIIGKRVYRWHPTGRVEWSQLDTSVGAVVPRAIGGFAVAVREGFAALDTAGRLTILAEIEADRPGNRMNDGKCDRLGRFWAGTMADNDEPRVGAFYRLDPDGHVARVLAGVTTSNGLAWSPDWTTMYYIDSPTGGVDAFDFEEAGGLITNRRRLITIPRADGLPDGMTVDSEGCLWIALYGGGAVRRYEPAGILASIVPVRASLVTSCSFGGADLADLYITTAADRHPHEPLAGAIFCCQPGVAGMPTYSFSG